MARQSCTRRSSAQILVYHATHAIQWTSSILLERAMQHLTLKRIQHHQLSLVVPLTTWSVEGSAWATSMCLDQSILAWHQLDGRATRCSRHRLAASFQMWHVSAAALRSRRIRRLSIGQAD
ncbi:hypothetical protein M440DRAFT_208092 [Trichoderma longibrachiatum ATCC 18648]|uniref:Uncharacterized protein n=1 Tax=Trichoderma longibrachiatum ATCC 18648 TaxID=983965 RepID=A0A2T4BQY4_TRILO|nr:hypothetical protein M440DRAFT_208092 [Trichoderma longibrachiatum ATCC 18648]